MVPQEELIELTKQYTSRTVIGSHAIVSRAAALRATRGTRGQGDELLRQNSLYPIEVSDLSERYIPLILVLLECVLVHC